METENPLQYLQAAVDAYYNLPHSATKIALA